MSSGFKLIDLEHWPRREHFEAYFRNTPCTWSMTVQLDVTKLVRSGAKMYPALLYACGRVANRHEEFRMSLDADGRPGVWDELHTSYTVFHKDTETFSCLWTPYMEDPAKYYAAYQRDIERWGRVEGFEPQPDMPKNIYYASMLPWESFEGFNLNLQKGWGFLLPTFTFGRYTEHDGRFTLPFAIQVHHAACDGFHACRFIAELRQTLEGLNGADFGGSADKGE